MIIRALYAVLTIASSSISFLIFNLRPSNILKGIVVFVELPSGIGLGIGVLVANLVSRARNFFS